MSGKTPLVLMILDGWGYSESRVHNAIAKANTPQWDAWWQNCPHLLLEASGLSVGLPDSQMGNSEVGHMHIGAGRVIQQDFTRINSAIADNTLDENGLISQSLTTLKQQHKALHMMGLLSPGGVHSHETHLFALLRLCKKLDFRSVYLHLFLDGRDTPPQSALPSLKKLEEVLKENPVAQIASLTGRYYAMDRDSRWERVEPVYKLLTEGQAEHCFDRPDRAVDSYYQQKLSDEFIPPTRIGQPKPMKDGDAVLFFNFRSDRARQLTSAFVTDSFTGFLRQHRPKLSQFISMTQYDEQLPTAPLFPPTALINTLGEVLAKEGRTQLRLAETEKYAHVTFFFNGGNETVFPNEKRLLIPSPKVATYDLQPEMSAPELTDALVSAIKSMAFDLIICNYANADMVGHSGNFAAAVQAIECLDHCMQRVGKALEETGGRMLITADHGNAEEMFDEATNQPHTAHTSEPVPLLYIGGGWHFTARKGSLTDIAPTILALIGIKVPMEMTGTVLLENDHA